MRDDLSIQPEKPDSPEVGALLSALDEYLASLYPPEANHILEVRALMEPSTTFLTARRAGRLVGCGAVRRMAGEPATAGLPFGEIKRMYVSPDSRGARVATQLLARLEAVLRQDGLALSLLETGRDQTEAVRLYERAGYARREPFAGYPDNGLSLFMGKTL
jgi:putative acetyltransferase